jgi:hypothetical protein
MAKLGFILGRNPDGVDDTVAGTLLVVKELKAAREVESDEREWTEDRVRAAIHNHIGDAQEYEGTLGSLVEGAIDGLREEGLFSGAPEVDELPGDGQPDELIERMAVIEKLAGFLADPSDDRECDCHGEGIDQEGDEWTLCECVLRRIGDLPVVRDTERERQARIDAKREEMEESAARRLGYPKVAES